MWGRWRHSVGAGRDALNVRHLCTLVCALLSLSTACTEFINHIYMKCLRFAGL